MVSGHAGAPARVAGELLEVAKALRDPSLEFWASAVALHVSIESGDLARAQAPRERAEWIAEELEMMEAGVAANPGISAWRSALAAMYCWGGRLDDAAAVVMQAAKDGFAHMPWDNYRMNARAEAWFPRDRSAGGGADTGETGGDSRFPTLDRADL